MNTKAVMTFQQFQTTGRDLEALDDEYGIEGPVRVYGDGSVYLQRKPIGSADPYCVNISNEGWSGDLVTIERHLYDWSVSADHGFLRERYFKEYPYVIFPRQLIELGFEDRSWHNDAMAQATHPLPDGNLLVVWCDHFLVSERELNGKEFTICTYTSDMEPIDEVGDGYDTIAQVLEVVRPLLATNGGEQERIFSELAAMRKLGLFDDTTHERARAVVREQAADWQCLSTHEMADLALDLARARVRA